MKRYFVYIMASRKDGALYIGVTSRLRERIWKHKQKNLPGFTEKYNIGRLVYFEETNDSMAALTREKQLKKWRRA